MSSNDILSPSPDGRRGGRSRMAAVAGALLATGSLVGWTAAGSGADPALTGSTCDDAREAILTGTQSGITTAMNKLVADKIRSGVHSGGPWHMPPHPEVSKVDAATMARHILAIKK